MIRKKLAELAGNEWVLLLLFLSAFVSVFALAALLVLLPLYALFTKQGKKLLPKDPAEALIFVFAVLALLSTFLFARNSTGTSFNIPAWMLKTLSLLIVILAFDITFALHIFTGRALDLGLKLSVVFSYFALALALLQKVMGWDADPSRPGRVASTFLNENYYGTFLEFAILIAMYLFLKEKNGNMRWLYLCSIPVNLLGLWLCQCRTSFLVVAISLLLFFCWIDKKVFFALVALGVAGIIVILWKPTLLPRLDSLGENLSYRTGIWKTAWRAFRDCPWIGRGYYAYSGIWWEYREADLAFEVIHAHNLYLETLLNFGVIGFLSLFGFMGWKSGKSLLILHRVGARREFALVLAVLCAVLIHGLTDITVFWPQTGLFAVILLAGMPAYFQTEQEK